MLDYSRSRRSRGGSKLPKFAFTFNVFTVDNLARKVFFGLAGWIIIIFAFFLWFSRDLPTPGKLNEANLAKSTRIYDRNGTVLYDIYNTVNRTYVGLPEISKDLQHATISIEDQDFYS